MQDQKNLLLATVLMAVVLLSWSWFYEKPRMEEAEKQKRLAAEQSRIINQPKQNIDATNGVLTADLADNAAIKQTNVKAEEKIQKSLPKIERNIAISSSANKRITISNQELQGSISLEGARFDDLTLINYTNTLDKNSGNVVLLAPVKTTEQYFADFGFISQEGNVELPKPNTIWESNNTKLTPGNPVLLSWRNSQNILFTIEISLDEHQMFRVIQKVKNDSGQAINVSPFGRINRVLNEEHAANYILHEGPIGVFDKKLEEFSYKKMAKDKSHQFHSQGGWLGISDKYWQTSIILDKNFAFDGKFSYQEKNQQKIYVSEFIGGEYEIAPGEELKLDHHLFTGAKRIALIDSYADQFDIPLFDRSVDFGWYYFLTKPFFLLIKFFSDILGNFGLSILMVTILVKLLMFPLANRSYGAMSKIRELQPQIDEIRKQHKGLQVNKEIIELYKREKVNPASGCLPMLIQIPVFFSLYKVLYVTIDMRHAPFFGWIKDLSAPDPTSIINLFGLLPFEVHGALHIGIWPILMGITMIVQQKLGPKISDPAQAKVMKILPFILIFVFAAFPAGLLIYWTWSNILSIIQQAWVNKKSTQNTVAKK